MWIGTQGDGLYVRSQEGISHYEHNPANKASLPHNDIYDMVADRHGRIWVATYGGGLALAQEGETQLVEGSRVATISVIARTTFRTHLVCHLLYIDKARCQAFHLGIMIIVDFPTWANATSTTVIS